MSSKKTLPGKKAKKSPILKSRKKNKKRQSRKTALIVLIICIIVVTCSIIAAIFIPKVIEENKEKELNKKLNSCLEEGYHKNHPSSADDKDAIKTMIITKHDLDSEDYTMGISCYKKYPVDGYQKMIEKLSSRKDTVEMLDLTNCVNNAIQNSAVTDDEYKRARSDSSLAFALLTRLSTGYQEQINCYEKHDTEGSDSKISELKIKKNELDSYIESAKYSPVYVGGDSSSFYCSTNTMGNYTYTSCY